MTFKSDKAQKTRQTIFSQAYDCNTGRVFRKVPRGNSRSLGGLRVCTISYSSTSRSSSSYTLPRQTRAIHAQAQKRSQIYSQEGKGSPTRLFLSSLKCPRPPPAVPEAERPHHSPPVLPSRWKHNERKVLATLEQPVRRDTLGDLRWEARPSTSLAPRSYFEVSS